MGEETFERKRRESSQIQHILAVGHINWANFSCQHCIQELPQQLSNFNIDEAKCYCCSNNHVTQRNDGGWTMEGEQDEHKRANNPRSRFGWTTNFQQMSRRIRLEVTQILLA